MDYEKKYKEALERARQFSEKPYLEDSKGIVDYIFPELKESEDERIRKEIISMFETLDRKDWIAWLEKQGDKDELIKELGEYKVKYTQEVLSQQLEKKSEQKPADKVEPKFNVGDVMRTLQEATNNITSGLPVVVSIDDKYYRCNNELIAIKDQYDYEYPPMNRKQKPAEWIEEDERNFDIIYGIIYNSCIAEDASRLNTWLLSLKPQKQWKPSKEQIMALRWVLNNVPYNGYKEEISGLLEQIKDL